MSYADRAAAPPPLSPIERLKADLPILYVLEDAGVNYWAEGGEYVCHNPFRPDSTPSFRIYSSRADGKLDRWNDFAESGSGDVVDLLQRMNPDKSFNECLEIGAELAKDAEGWTGAVSAAPKRSLDLRAAEAYINNNWGATDAITQFLESRTDQLAEVPAALLKDTFRIGEDNGLLIPYYNRDDEFIAVKTRAPGGKAMAASGSDFSDVLYGEWLDTDPSRPVVLCEGETDVWSGTHALQGTEFVFLGLPTGAGAHPKQAARLAGRRVYLAFDGDDAGRAALYRWATALVAEDAEVSIVALPETLDLSNISDLPKLLEAARRYDPPLTGILELGTQYHHAAAKGSTPISDFVAVVLRAIVDPMAAVAFEVEIRGRTHLIRPDDLLSATRFRTWATERGLSWAGSESDTQALASHLRNQALFVPTEEAADIAGLYDNHFVWPDGCLGDRSILYVPPSDRAVVPLSLKLNDGRPPVVDQIQELMALSKTGVTHPILAWLAVAPLRSLFQQFPILNVSGGSGTGKTTLLSTMIPALTGSELAATMTGTTPYALLAFMQSTNAFPVWFDEYRPGARSATLREFDQLARDTYTGQASLKGGGGDTWNRVQSYQTSAPIVVSGEDAFSETSHMERMILVRLPAGNKDPDALLRVQHWEEDGLARTYLSWLLSHEGAGSEWSPVVHPEGPYELSDRQRYNLGVLRIGWNLLHAFMQDHGLLHASEPNWEDIVREATEAVHENPVLDAIRWALDESSMADAVWLSEHHVNVRVETLVAEIKRKAVFVLPGGAKAVRKYLIENYDAVSERVTRIGKQVRVLQFARDHLEAE